MARPSLPALSALPKNAEALCRVPDFQSIPVPEAGPGCHSRRQLVAKVAMAPRIVRPMSPRFQQNKAVEEYRQLAEKCREIARAQSQRKMSGSSCWPGRKPGIS
jgi:hypothetical protein